MAGRRGVGVVRSQRLPYRAPLGASLACAVALRDEAGRGRCGNTRQDITAIGNTALWIVRPLFGNCHFDPHGPFRGGAPLHPRAPGEVPGLIATLRAPYGRSRERRRLAGAFDQGARGGSAAGRTLSPYSGALDRTRRAGMNRLRALSPDRLFAARQPFAPRPKAAKRRLKRATCPSVSTMRRPPPVHAG